MKKLLFLLLCLPAGMQHTISQINTQYIIPSMPNPEARQKNMELEWASLQLVTPGLSVRDCFLFLFDALDTRFLKPGQVEWLLKLVQTRVVTDNTIKENYGNIYWGWKEKGSDVGDGNNVQFSVQYGILIKMLFYDRLSSQAKKTLDEIFETALNGVRNQKIRISYSNIYIMRIWNMVALGQAYNQAQVIEEGRVLFKTWLNHIAQYGNREYDSPTYCGVDIESLLLIQTFIKDPDIKSKASDALNFFLTDLSSHYNKQGGFLGGAHSRDYNRVFGRDLLEEKYFNPLLGRKNSNVHLFHQVCLAALQKLQLTHQQTELMNRKNRFIVQRWDSLDNTFVCDFVGSKVSIASSNQAYSPDDKPFVMYLSSPRIPEMPNIVYVMEGRNDHYGTWSVEGKGEKLKHLMPANYPADGGWNKTRHLMPFIQSAQNKGEFVMLVSGEKDRNCIYDYLNSTIILPNTFDEIWLGNNKINVPLAGSSVSLDNTKTFFAKFEDVVIAFRYLLDNSADTTRASLYNDGFKYQSARENFEIKNKEALRLTLRHPANGKAIIAMWWKVEEGIKTATDFYTFRQKVLRAPVISNSQNGFTDIAVITPAGKLGVKADLLNKKRIGYYNPVPLPADFLFNVDGVEIGKPMLEKYVKRKLAP